ncbi:MAG: bifunctional oligoribonuclease/PAP phosphatase NrnA [Puniceicoccales bacterium]|jgi:phosphoesterase RecJ-like protein|nr:bifunctional oligoribonuclease/PAP phosphatase NrnA [Puniceicoccales bacterium]
MDGNKLDHFPNSEIFFATAKSLAGKAVGIVGHTRPDGDCIGSQVAMAEILTSFGANPVLINETPKISDNLRQFLGNYQINSPKDGIVDEYIFVDCGTVSRGGIFTNNLPKKPIMSIDHHMGNDLFADNNFVFSHAVAASEIIADYAYQSGFPVTKAMARALYVGIVTDTGKFSYTFTVARTLQLGAQLICDGANPNEIFRTIYQNESREKFALIQRFIQSFRFLADGKICIGIIRDEDFLTTGTTMDDTEGMVNLPRSIKDVVIAVIVQILNGRIKISMRTDIPEMRLDLLAAKFGGGGHACAATFSTNGAENKILPNLINELQEQLKLFTQTNNGRSTGI